MLRKLKKQNISILVSTPYMDEASLCDRIALMQQGEILRVDSPEEIVHSYPRKLYAVEAANSYALLHELRRNPAVHSVYNFGASLHLTFKGQHASLSGLSLREIEPCVEDCFIELLKQEKDHGESNSD